MANVQIQIVRVSRSRVALFLLEGDYYKNNNFMLVNPNVCICL
jgi:hypothetical protein